MYLIVENAIKKFIKKKFCCGAVGNAVSSCEDGVKCVSRCVCGGSDKLLQSYVGEVL